HVDQLVQLLGDLLEAALVDVDDHRDAGDLRMLGGADGERGDVVAAPGEQRGDAGEHAGLVLDQDREGLAVRGHHENGGDGLVNGHQMALSHSGLMPWAIWISSLETPAGALGHTMASALTVKSTSTGRSLISIAAAMVASMSSSRSQRSPAQP